VQGGQSPRWNVASGRRWSCQRYRRVVVGFRYPPRPAVRSLRITAVFVMAGICLAISGSSPAGQAVVPDVVGLDVLSAYDAVHEAGFAVQINEPIDITPNRISDVSHQSRAAGTAGHPGTPVVLTLGRGPFGLLPTGGTQRAPRLVGKPLHDAVHALESLGLLWSAAPLAPLPATLRPSLLDNYRVTEQTPKPGTRFTQTVVRELAGGSVLSETSTVGLATELRPN
jgi:beta-lactam-binding protein with PASTA domain